VIRDLAQLVFFGFWFVVLLRYRPLRALVRNTPRSLAVAVGALVATWLVVQVTDQRLQFYPVISVYMYGDHTPAASLSGVALTGTACDGNRQRLDMSFMGRGRIRSRLQVLYGGLARRTTAADSAKQWDIIDRLLISVGRMHNRVRPERPLCATGLDEIRIPREQYESGKVPAPVIVRDVPLP